MKKVSIIKNMQNMRKLMRHFQVVAFIKRTVLFCFVLLMVMSISSCLSRAEEAENELCMINASKDTIVVAFKYRSSSRDYYMLEPCEFYRIGGSENSISFMLRDNYEKLDIEVEIYKLAEPDEGVEVFDWKYESFYIGECLAKWVPPLVSLPAEINSFYNIDSWVVNKGGNKNKWDIAVFTIYEEDLNINEH